MPGRDRRGPDRWNGEEDASSAGAPERAADREPGLRADYHTEQGLTPEDREAAGEGIDGEGEATGGDGGSFAPTADEAAVRKRRVDAREDPGAWFGRPPAAPRLRRLLTGRRPRG